MPAVTESSTIFVRELFHSLWERYRGRVSYVRDYERMVREHGATFFNDHVYACFEIAERGPWMNPETGNREIFQGFLGPQANQLFEMTAMKAIA
jgi:hypothetical protein